MDRGMLPFPILARCEIQHKQLGDHGRLPFVVKLHDVLLGEVMEGHFDHADSTVDDLLPGVNDGLGLLPAKHRTGDFRCVGEVRQPSLLDMDTRFGVRL